MLDLTCYDIIVYDIMVLMYVYIYIYIYIRKCPREVV